SFFFFFFQAEDGIRDRNVTGVQTCALPICSKGKTSPLKTRIIYINKSFSPLTRKTRLCTPHSLVFFSSYSLWLVENCTLVNNYRSEERRVGKEYRSRRWLCQYSER